MPKQSESDLHDRPSAAVLVDAVRELLEGPLVDQLDAAGRFQVRVAAGVLRIVARELDLGPAQVAEHAALLAALGVLDEATLAAGIRDGRFDNRLAEVTDAVRHTVALRVAVDHPGYDEPLS